MNYDNNFTNDFTSSFQFMQETDMLLENNTNNNEEKVEEKNKSNVESTSYDPDTSNIKFANKKSKKTFKRIYKSTKPATKVHLDEMKKSEISYFVNTQASLSGRQGSSQYNFKKNQFDILIDKNASNPIGALGDELTHAYQFETGKIGYIEMVNGEVRTLGYDMEDEVDSKRGEIDATESVNKKEGINIQLSNTAKAFQKADTDPIPSGQTRSGMIENYFKKDPSAQQYLNQFDPRGKQMGVNIPGNANYTKQTLLKAVQAGQFKDFIYREKGGDGKIQTVKGSK